MSRVLIGSISSLMPAASRLGAAYVRFSTKTFSSAPRSITRRRDAGKTIDLRRSRAPSHR